MDVCRTITISQRYADQLGQLRLLLKSACGDQEPAKEGIDRAYEKCINDMARVADPDGQDGPLNVASEILEALRSKEMQDEIARAQKKNSEAIEARQEVEKQLPASFLAENQDRVRDGSLLQELQKMQTKLNDDLDSFKKSPPRSDSEQMAKRAELQSRIQGLKPQFEWIKHSNVQWESELSLAELKHTDQLITRIRRQRLIAASAVVVILVIASAASEMLGAAGLTSWIVISLLVLLTLLSLYVVPRIEEKIRDELRIVLPVVIFTYMRIVGGAYVRGAEYSATLARLNREKSSHHHRQDAS